MLDPERASLSNTAMRSGSGTKSADPVVVTFPTNSTIAAFGAVSFQDGRGSVCAVASDGASSVKATTPNHAMARWRGLLPCRLVFIQPSMTSSILSSGYCS
jgi:hypothetical protein